MKNIVSLSFVYLLSNQLLYPFTFFNLHNALSQETKQLKMLGGKELLIL